MPRIRRFPVILALLTGSALAAPLAAQEAPQNDPLVQGFETPPEAARPRIWWHWLSGNIDKEGIRLDLEWMHGVGIGGVQMFDGDMGAPKIVDHRLKALSPEWLSALRYAAEEANRLGLEFGMAAAPGWSETGGPWVTPQDAMKKLVWSRTRVDDGTSGPILLKRPPDIAGPMQDIAIQERSFGGETSSEPIHFYRDIAVLAYRLPAIESSASQSVPDIRCSGGAIDGALLTDGSLSKSVTLSDPSDDAPVSIQFTYDTPQPIGAFTYAGPLPGRFTSGPSAVIEASDDGSSWHTLAHFPGAAQTPAPQRTLAFPITRAKYFRVTFTKGPAMGDFPLPLAISELSPQRGGRVDDFEEKAGFGVLMAPTTVATPAYDDGVAIPGGDVIDLTDKLRPDGSLDWQPPKGSWEIVRMGYSPTGTKNHPATPEVTGLEVDKMNARHVRGHLDAYMAPVLKALAGQPGLKYLLTDSWEAGVQNWTEDMVAEFRKRRGYDPTPWFPVLTGRIVESPQASDKFLWDYRRTIADLIAQDHYGTITNWAKAHGLGYYGEAVGASWPTIADGIQAKRYTDIPMGEYWAMPFGGVPAAFQGVPSDEFPADIEETASTAHLYGKPFVAAEALTSSLPMYTATPWNLKWVADKYMAMGVNRHVLHTSPHQPGRGNKPGLTLGPFSQTFTRNETWADMAKPWITYLARSSFLLQQGRAVDDILYFYGEGAPSGVPYREKQSPAIPDGYATDYIDAEALLSLTSVKDGRIVTPSGASYAVLVLPDHLSRMTAPVARKLRDLVAAGATLVGPRPATSPSLTSTDGEVRAIVGDLWGATDGRLATHATYGKGNVYWGLPMASVLARQNVAPDAIFARETRPGAIVYTHRHLKDGDIFFVSNQTDAVQRVDAQFRVAGRAAELWRADTGEHSPASYRIDRQSTTVPMTLAPYDARFVVFRQPTSQRARSVAAVKETKVTTLDGPWDVHFPEGWGAPEAPRFETLSDWSKSDISGIRYFSGTATYSRTIDVDAAMLHHRRLLLDLGEVHELARVRVNGKDVGIAWKPPYRVDVTEALHTGANRIEIEVANLWRNRLIGDAQPDAAKRYTFTSAPSGKGQGPFSRLGDPPRADSPLLPSGLIGPVTVIGAD